LIKLKEKYDEQDLMECMKALLDVFNELRLEYMPPKEEVDRIAVEIANRDKMLEFSDCQIAAYALADMNSVVLVTTDKDLIESEELKKLEKEGEEGRRTRKLDITSYEEPIRR
jgi:predicted nucleic acid-binding protein